MELVQLVTGWLDRTLSFITIGKVTLFSKGYRIEDEQGVTVNQQETPSKRGYRFEHEELKRLMYRLRHFETVEFTDAYGTPISPETIEQRYGADGGIDCIIRIVAPTERGARNVQGRIRNIIIRGNY
jgi:hypothetical protein